MRSITLLALLLLAGCAHKNGVLTETTDLCPSDAPKKNLKFVRIDIDSVTKKVNPKVCYVYADTEVGWYEAHGKSFDADFKTKSPTSWGKMNFDSKPVGSHQEADFKAKKVDAREEFTYDVKVNGEYLDPTIIIDP